MPSPQLIVTFWIGAEEFPDVEAVGLMVQLMGTPTDALPLAPHARVTVGGLSALSANCVVLVPPAETVMLVVLFVVSCTRASPLASVTAVFALSVPKSLEKLRGVLLIGLLLASKRPATTVTVPPVMGTLVGSVRTVTRSAAAVPTFTLTPPALLLPDPVLADPENALMTAVPDGPAMNVEVAFPFTVGASIGSIRPVVVWKVTIVPL